MRPSPLAILLASSLLAGGVGLAQEEDGVAEAKRRYGRGMAHYHLNEYDKAIEEFAAAYRAKPDPVFLYNIAQAHRLSRHPEQALEFYEKYLKTSRDAPNRAEVMTRIRDLRKLIQDAGKVESGLPNAPLPPAGRGKPPPEEEPPAVAPSEPPPVSTAPPARPEVPAAALQADVAKAPEAPVYKRWWFWTGAAVAVAAVGAGIGVGVATTTGPRERGLPELVAQ